MDRAAMAARKVAVLDAASQRYQGKAAEVARTAQLLTQGGPQAASSPDRVARFMARESLKRATRYRRVVGEERILGPINLQEVPPTEAARAAGRPVARIVELLANNRVGEGFATGFQVSSGLLFTNWHVFPDAGQARGCGAQFGNERNISGLVDNGTIFELDPDGFFLSDEALDIAIVAIVPTALIGQATLDSYGSVSLIPAQGKILVGHPVSIIQHPGGRIKNWAVEQNKLILEPGDDDLFLTYSTDTQEGSSGSPAFNFDWELVAVHHSGVPRRVNGQIMTTQGQVWQRGMPESDIDWIANEGARVSKVVAFLQAAAPAGASQRARLTQLIAGIDTSRIGVEATPTRVTDPIVPTNGAQPMHIVVNGTANFYFGAAPPPIATPAVPALPPPAAGAGAEARIRFDPDYDNRPGYDPAFLAGFDVPLPTAPTDELLLSGSNPHVLDYHNYSLVMHRTRRLAMWTAANVDYSSNKRWRSRDEFGTDTWKPDPRIPITAQIEDVEFYAPARKFDRGHLVRRDDVAWGDTRQLEEYGNSDSFHWTNCTPQHEQFNRDLFQYNGLWGQVENHIASQAENVENRLTILAGPVLSAGDPSRDFGSGIAVKVPMVFWKVVVVAETTGQQSTLRAYGFLLDQTEAIEQYGWEGRFRVGVFREQQVSLAEITTQSRVVFDQVLHDADPLALVPNESRRRRIRSLGDIVLR